MCTVHDIAYFSFGGKYIIKEWGGCVHFFYDIDEILNVLTTVFKTDCSYYPSITFDGNGSLLVQPEIRWNLKPVTYPDGWLERYAEAIRIAVITHTLTGRWGMPKVMP